jgi:hypothetical protein
MHHYWSLFLDITDGSLLRRSSLVLGTAEGSLLCRRSFSLPTDGAKQVEFGKCMVTGTIRSLSLEATEGSLLRRLSLVPDATD